MFKKDNRYFALGITLLSVIIISVLFFVVLTNIGTVLGAIKYMLGICSSVIYGFAFAYIMNPVRKFTEKLVRKIFGGWNMTERGLRRLCRAIGVTVAVLVFFAIVYGLIASVVPKVYASLRDLCAGDSLDNLSNSANSTIERWSRAQSWKNGSRITIPSNMCRTGSRRKSTSSAPSA